MRGVVPDCKSVSSIARLKALDLMMLSDTAKGVGWFSKMNWISKPKRDRHTS